jgi:ribonuclease HI
MAKWYVVFSGRVSGVYDDWDECNQQVKGFKGCSFKSFKSRAEAEARWRKHLEDERKKKTKTTFIVIPGLLAVIAVLMYFFVL